ncbi:hypothetical protein WMF28_42425 [Sorangium sp. So ce590]|uniref:hypothetical protein n=1 Tax=Sorangium sp. So ce590 TaxID=3133317 RepID=UPI003F5E57FC
MVLHRHPRSLSSLLITAAVFVCLLVGHRAEAAPSYTLFESGQVRPLALSPDRKLLLAANTPDNRLEIFRVTSSGLSHLSSVSVGLEPVAVAARSNDEVWVVNHLSDSVSVVDVSFPSRPRLVRTLLVGDEPRDIVFAGPGRSRAFITAAHRGQNAPFDPQLTTPGVGRADVWVFNANAVVNDASLGGAPLTILTFFTDTPRALAVSPDGASVYAAGFHTGNRTTAVHRVLVEEGGGLPPPITNFLGEPQPSTSLIVRHDGDHWVDTLGRPWDDEIRFSLPDKDVFVIDAMASPPQQRPGSAGFFTGVGTILYNMVVNPANGKVYVSNTEAFNLDRFEGPGTFAGSSVRGHLHESRITVLGGGAALPRHLNKHIDYATCCAPVPNPENAKSLATPVDMAVTSDGSKLYVAAFGSSKIGVFTTAELESDTFTPSLASQIPVSGGGPSGLALDQPRGRLYVLTRFDNSISIINTVTRAETAHIALHNPEPESVVRGRVFLHDASFTSSHGDSSCASCHVFGDLDSLAWDLGNPDATTQTNAGPFTSINPPFPADTTLKPMKGPMTTQSLRGMANHGPMHWRGDRTGGNDEPTAQPDSGSFDERAAFRRFQAGFTGLLGRDAPIPDDDMEAFTDFILQLTYPPNPIRNLDNSLTPDQQAGRDHFVREGVDGTFSCASCHSLDPDANADVGEPFPGFFGSDGSSVGQENGQSFKNPHLRNMYQKVGMFGMAAVPSLFHPGDNEFMGDQIRGFGFMHDGVMDTLFRFHQAIGFEESGFTPNGFPLDASGVILRQQAVDFMLAFDTNLAPIVGQQVTLGAHNAAAAWPRIDLLLERAEVGECDLVAKMPFFLEEIGLLYAGGGQFTTDRSAAPPVSDVGLRWFSVLTGHRVTYTCMPPGSGPRSGVDRDGDGIRDGDERDAGTDPADPSSPG